MWLNARSLTAHWSGGLGRPRAQWLGYQGQDGERNIPGPICSAFVDLRSYVAAQSGKVVRGIAA